MSEIKNNLHNYGYNQVERVDIKKKKDSNQNKKNVKEAMEQEYIKDTGVLGLSQVLGLNGGNITKSVDEAVEMAQSCPIKMLCSEDIFDSMYEKYRNDGLTDSEAYIKALADEQEFLDLASSIKR